MRPIIGFFFTCLFYAVLISLFVAFGWSIEHLEIWYCKIVAGLTLGPFLMVATQGALFSGGVAGALTSVACSLWALVLVGWGIIQGLFFRA